MNVNIQVELGMKISVGIKNKVLGFKYLAL